MAIYRTCRQQLIVHNRDCGWRTREELLPELYDFIKDEHDECAVYETDDFFDACRAREYCDCIPEDGGETLLVDYTWIEKGVPDPVTDDVGQWEIVTAKCGEFIEGEEYDW